MFRVVGSTDLARLVDAAARDLAEAPLPAHVDEWIVVPSAGMRRWVTLQLADRWGVAASLVTPFPADAVARLAALFLGDADTAAFTRDVLTWRVDAALGELRDGPVAAYLEHDPDGVKRYGLAKRVARALREMQSTRLDVLDAWERGETRFDEPEPTDASTRLDETEAWQAGLWRGLLETARPDEVPASRRLAALLERLQGDVDAPPPGLPSRVTLFALGVMAPAFVDVFVALGRWVDVTAYVLDLLPPRADSAPLVESLGAQGLAFRRRLREAAAGEVRDVPADDAPPTDTTLGVVQRAIRGAPPNGPVALPDRDSLTLHRCHTPLREIEVVHDLVLAALTADETLRPHDVVVLLPDVELYAPFVDAVFGRRHGGLPDLPYHVADRVPRVRPLIHAVLRGLDVIAGRFEVGDVLGLLEEPTIRRRFGLAEADVASAQRWAHDACIRWGVDGAHRERFGQPRDDTLTWRQGLDRLLIGVAVGRHDGLVDGCLPTAGDMVGDVDVLGRFAAFVETLSDHADDVDEARAPVEWRAWLARLTSALTEPGDEDERDDLRALHEAFASLDVVAERDDVADTQTFAVIRAWLEDAVGDAGFGGGFLTGRISFAALRPLRTIPFEVVILCGMDDGSFPRRTRSSPFDLVAARPRPGDRDDRADDRELFLEVVLAARDRLAITWQGRSPRDDHERAVSVCVSELLDVVDRTFAKDGDEKPASELLTSSRGLQRYSPSEFGADLHPRGHSLEALTVARALVEHEAPGGVVPPFVTAPLERVADELVLDLEQLVRAWSESPRFFFRETLQVDLKEWTDELSDREPLVLDGLGAYQGRDAVLAGMLRGGPARDVVEEREVLRQLGVLPPEVRGDLDHAELRAAVDVIGERLGELPSRAPEAIDLRGTFDDGVRWRLTGRIDDLAPDGLKVVRAGKVKEKTRAQAWVRHVALAAWAREHPGRDLPTTTRIVGNDRAETLTPLDDPRPLLEDLMAGAREMLAAPRPLLEHASPAYRRAVDDVPVDPPAKKKTAKKKTTKKKTTKKKADPVDAARKAFTEERADVADVHVLAAFRDRPDLDDGEWVVREPGFEAYAARLWAPLLEHLVVEDGA